MRPRFEPDETTVSFTECMVGSAREAANCLMASRAWAVTGSLSTRRPRISEPRPDRADRTSSGRVAVTGDAGLIQGRFDISVHWQQALSLWGFMSTASVANVDLPLASRSCLSLINRRWAIPRELLVSPVMFCASWRGSPHMAATTGSGVGMTVVTSLAASVERESMVTITSTGSPPITPASLRAASRRSPGLPQPAYSSRLVMPPSPARARPAFNQLFKWVGGPYGAPPIHQRTPSLSPAARAGDE